MVNNDLACELAIMQDIATELGKLDPLARGRVLHWLQARFQEDPVVRLPAAPAAATSPVGPLRVVPPPDDMTDELLSVETLSDLFGPGVPKRVTEPTPKTISGMLTEFVTEFQDIAREWDDACAAPAEVRRPARILSAAS
jgi:hypothetical protein